MDWQLLCLIVFTVTTEVYRTFAAAVLLAVEKLWHLHMAKALGLQRQCDWNMEGWKNKGDKLKRNGHLLAF